MNKFITISLLTVVACPLVPTGLDTPLTPANLQWIAVVLESYFLIPCKVSCPCAYIQSMCMGTRLCKEWENNFQRNCNSL